MELTVAELFHNIDGFIEVDTDETALLYAPGERYF